MGISVSLILIAVGAILTWAVTTTVSGIDINVVGVILMIVGAAGLDPLDALLVELGWLPHARAPTRPSSATTHAPALSGVLMKRPTGPAPCRPRTVVASTMDSVTSIETVGDAHVVTLHGEIDAFTAPSLRDDLRVLVEETGALVVVVDLAAVTFLDSSALGALVGVAPAAAGARRAAPDRAAAHRRLTDLRAHRARRRPRSLPRSGSGAQRSERVKRRRVPEPSRARADLDVVGDRADDREAHSVLAELLGAPLGHRFALEAGAVVLDDHLELVVVAQGQLDRDVALRRPRRRAGRRWRRPR